MSRKKGNLAEEKAVKHLESQGFKMVEQNFYIRGGEIDIIAKKDGALHFIEVKSGSSFEPVYNITPKKLHRVIKTANLYMKKIGYNDAFCIDAVIVKDETIELLENITL